MVTSRWFDVLSLLVILSNSVLLAIEDPNAPPDSPRNRAANDAEVVFTVLFGIELLVRLIARGVVAHQGALLRSGWGWVDLAAVIAGVASAISSSGGAAGLGSLRALRLLRPLKAARSVPSLRILVEALLSSVVPMLNVFALFAFAYMVFALIGVQALSGTLRNRCVEAVPSATVTFADNVTLLDPAAVPDGFAIIPGGVNVTLYEHVVVPGEPEDVLCSETFGGRTCGSGAVRCGLDEGNNDFLNRGYTNFDNLASSWLTLFQVTTMDSWESIAAAHSDAYSWLIKAYFSSAVFVCSFFLLQLAMSVLFEQYQTSQCESAIEDIKGEPASTEEILAVFSSRARKLKLYARARLARRGANAYGAAAAGATAAAATQILDRPGAAGTAAAAAGVAHRVPPAPPSITAEPHPAPLPPPPPPPPLSSSNTPTPLPPLPMLSSARPDENAPRAAARRDRSGSGDSGYADDGGGGEGSVDGSAEGADDDGSDDESDKIVLAMAPWRRRLRRVVMHPGFEIFVVVVIVLNSVALAAEHHDQPDSLTDILFVFNVIFTVIFAVEVVVRIVALTFGRWVREGQNLFDAVIAVASVVELATSGGASVSVFRVLKLLRVFRLVRYWPSFQRIIKVIVASVPSLAACLALLLLFVFIFALAAMQFFGGVFDDPAKFPEGRPRQHYDTFFWAVISIITIIISEWSAPCYDAMHATHWTAVFFFIVVVTIGNFVLLNLFIAVLSKSFDTVDSEDPKILAQPLRDIPVPLLMAQMRAQILADKAAGAPTLKDSMLGAGRHRSSEDSDGRDDPENDPPQSSVLGKMRRVRFGGASTDRPDGNSRAAHGQSRSRSNSRSRSRSRSRSGSGSRSDSYSYSYSYSYSSSSAHGSSASSGTSGTGSKPRSEVQEPGSPVQGESPAVVPPSTFDLISSTLLRSGIAVPQRADDDEDVAPPRKGANASPGGHTVPSPSPRVPLPVGQTLDLYGAPDDAQVQKLRMRQAEARDSSPHRRRRRRRRHRRPHRSADDHASPSEDPGNAAAHPGGGRGGHRRGGHRRGGHRRGRRRSRGRSGRRAETAGEASWRRGELGSLGTIVDDPGLVFTSDLGVHVPQDPMYSPESFVDGPHDHRSAAESGGTPKRKNRSLFGTFSSPPNVGSPRRGGSGGVAAAMGWGESHAGQSADVRGSAAAAAEESPIRMADLEGVLPPSRASRRSTGSRGSARSVAAKGTEAGAGTVTAASGAASGAAVAASSASSAASASAPSAASASSRADDDGPHIGPRLSRQATRNGEVDIVSAWRSEDRRLRAAAGNGDQDGGGGPWGSRRHYGRGGKRDEEDWADLLSRIRAARDVNDLSGPITKVKDPFEVPELRGQAYFLLGPQNRFRVSVAKVMFSRQVELFVAILILLSCAQLAIETPGIDEDSRFGRALYYLDVVFAAVFLLESFLRSVALGLAFHRGAYLRSGFNVLEFFVAIASAVSLIPGVSYRWVRCVRALRPLRFAHTVEKLRVVVDTLFRSGMSIVNIYLVNLVVVFAFAVVAVSLFGGKLYICSAPDAAATRSACLAAGHEWVKQDQTYDNVAFAMMTLMSMATTDDWAARMYEAIDAVSHDEAPRRDHNPAAAVFFVVFMFVQGLVILNLFLVTVVDNYAEIQAELDGSLFLTERQRDWARVQKGILRAPPPRVPPEPESGSFRRHAYWIVTASWFEAAVLACVIANVAVMAIKHHGQPEAFEVILEGSNVFFVAIFVAEAALKLAAFGPSWYFAIAWNKFDFAITVLSVLGLFVDFVAFSIGVDASLLRVFRALRVFRVVKSLTGIKRLLLTLYFALPSIFNVAAVLALVTFVFAVIGVAVFGDLDLAGARVLDDNLNFRNSPSAMYTLYVAATGDGWIDMMLDTQDVTGYILYWSLYITIVPFIVLALIVALVLEHFSDSFAKNATLMGEEDYEKFRDVWGQLDPRSTGEIPMRALPVLLYRLGSPLGVRPDFEAIRMRRLVKELAIPEHDGRLHIRDVVTLLTKHALEVDFEGHQIPFSIRSRWDARYASYHDTAGGSRFTTREGFAALEIQRAWRRRAKWLRLGEMVSHYHRAKAIRLYRGRGKAAVSFSIGGLPPENMAAPGTVTSVSSMKWLGRKKKKTPNPPE